MAERENEMGLQLQPLSYLRLRCVRSVYVHHVSVEDRVATIAHSVGRSDGMETAKNSLLSICRIATRDRRAGAASSAGKLGRLPSIRSRIELARRTGFLKERDVHALLGQSDLRLTHSGALRGVFFTDNPTQSLRSGLRYAAPPELDSSCLTE